MYIFTEVKIGYSPTTGATLTYFLKLKQYLILTFNCANDNDFHLIEKVIKPLINKRAK
jgi:hypothetical protein